MMIELVETWRTRTFFCRSTKSHKHQSSTEMVIVINFRGDGDDGDDHGKAIM